MRQKFQICVKKQSHRSRDNECNYKINLSKMKKNQLILRSQGSTNKCVEKTKSWPWQISTVRQHTTSEITQLVSSFIRSKSSSNISFFGNEKLFHVFGKLIIFINFHLKIHSILILIALPHTYFVIVDYLV